MGLNEKSYIEYSLDYSLETVKRRWSDILERNRWFVIMWRRKSRERKVDGYAETQVSKTIITSLESGGKICPSCGFTNSYSARFCEKCGTALVYERMTSGWDKENR